MACQYALLRLAVPGAISTAVMTGNLANAVLSAMDLLTDRHPLLPYDSAPVESLAWLLARVPLGLSRCRGSSFIGRRLGLVPSGSTGCCCNCGAVAAASSGIAPTAIPTSAHL